jgi:glycosyltransferase involved in cell wall biosynthesis
MELTMNARISDGWDAEFLRSTAWEISERKPADAFTPLANHAALAMVHPCRGLAHWRISPEWIDETRCRRAEAWHNCRMVLRLYDVSYIAFNGLNANRMQDQPLPCICGQMFFQLPHAGTWQVGEVGFLLRNGEFIPAARSQTVSFPRASASSHGSQEALLVDDDLRCEAVANLWDQERILKERRIPVLRHPLRIAVLHTTLDESGRYEAPPEFVMQLATGLSRSGHEVHLVVPAGNIHAVEHAADGIRFHPVEARCDGSPLEAATAFCRAAEERFKELPPFDIVHVHEWLAGAGFHAPNSAKVCSLTSLESTRRNGTPPNALSLDIEDAERRAVNDAGLLLVPGWLHERAVAELRIDGAHVHGFAMEARAPNEWNCPIDYGQVKRDIRFGPMDRLILFIGPLEHAAGPDLLLDAMPIVLQRVPNLRLAYAGGGELFGELKDRARQRGIEYAVRFLGHVGRNHVVQLLRASEALALPSRYRTPFDDAVVDLARLAGRPVITTHGGPAHLIRHEETGIVTYDNPGSMVWALDRILGDPVNSQRMGENSGRNDNHAVSWGELAPRYLELCAASFPQLHQPRQRAEQPSAPAAENCACESKLERI